MKLSISMDEDMKKRIDEYAKSNYASRSGIISIACNQFLNAAEATKAIKTMSMAMKKIADTGKIDEEQKQILQDFERLVIMMQS